MYLLFVQSDRGLAAAKGGKFMFPDKSSNIVSPGVYDCTITYDKGNYAFVTGKHVRIPDFDEIESAVMDFITEKTKTMQTVRARQIAKEILVITTTDNGWVSIGFLSKDGFVSLAEYDNLTPAYHNARHLYR